MTPYQKAYEESRAVDRFLKLQLAIYPEREEFIKKLIDDNQKEITRKAVENHRMGGY